MPTCGGWHRTSGSNIPDFKTKEVNFEIETKIGGQTEDFVG